MAVSDLLDALDRALVEALQLRPRASAATLAATLGVSDQTVLRRIRRLRSDAGLAIRARRARVTEDEQWIVRIRCAPNQAEELAALLAIRGDTSYVTILSGGGEIACGLQPRTRSDRDALLLRHLQRTKRIISFDAFQILHPFYGGPLSWLTKLDALTPEQRSRLRGPTGATPATSMPGSDGPDAALLRKLAADARSSVSELSAASGLAPASVARRLDAWETSGALYYDVDLRSDVLGRPTKGMFWIRTRPRALEEVGTRLAALAATSFVAAISGPIGLVAYGAFDGVGDVYEFLTRDLGRMTGIDHVETTLVLREVGGEQATVASHSAV